MKTRIHYLLESGFEARRVRKMMRYRLILHCLLVGSLCLLFAGEVFANNGAIVVPLGDNLYVIPRHIPSGPESGFWIGDNLSFIVSDDEHIVSLEYAYNGTPDCNHCKFTIQNLKISSNSFLLHNNTIGFELIGFFTDSRHLSARVTVNSPECSLSNYAVSADVNKCISDINLGNEVTGSWIADCESTHRPGRFAKYYVFLLSSSAEVQIDLESNIDTYLYLLSGTGMDRDIIIENDDGGVGTNSRITKSLSPGTYTIEVTTYASGKTGDFTLTLSVK